ncbi:MAG: sigma-70 family RNA polymerase sigma factor [Gaiellales bacterium]|nr:sigma-70 family RNA polymerase sigma factor [Gaiellales bacterium]
MEAATDARHRAAVTSEDATRRQGDITPQAVVSRYGRLVSSLCRRMTRDEEAAREAAQEVWVAVLGGLGGFRGDSSLSTWIYSITRRVVVRYAQAQRTYSTRFLSDFFEREGEPQSPAKSDVEHEVWVRSMCDQCLCGIAQCLEPDVRLGYLLRDVAELDYAEVAQVLEVSPEAARQIVSRARRRLNHFLNGHCSLANPSGPCRCRMHRHVAAVDLPAEYRRLRRTVGRVRVFKESEQILPARNYWHELSQTCA